MSKAAEVSAIYLALTLVISYPLITRFNSFIIGGSEDGAMSLWGFWWFRFSLLDLGENPLSTSYIFYPDGVSLLFHSLPKLLSSLGIPLQYLFGLTASYNLVVIFTFVGTGLATYLLAYHFLRQHVPAAFAGALFMLAPYRWGQISHLTLLSTMLIPVFILFLVKGWEALKRDQRRWWFYFVLAGCALGLTAYDTEYYAIFLLIFTYIYLFYCLLAREQGEAAGRWRDLFIGSLLATAVAAVIYSPMLIASLVEIGRNGSYTSSASIPSSLYASDLARLLLPGKQSALLGGFFWDMQSQKLAEPGFLGWTALALMAVAIAFYYRVKEVWLWIAVGVIFIILALGPEPLKRYASLPGALRGLSGPFRIFELLPLLNGIRVPSRFICMTTLSVSLLAGYGVKAVIGSLNRLALRRVLVAAFVLVVGFAALLEYMPKISLTSTEVPGVYEKMRDADETGSVLAIPLGWQTGYTTYGDEQTWTLLTQIVHQRPMIGGMVARAPEGWLKQEAERPVLGFLSDPAGRDPGPADMDPENIESVFSRYGISFIVCHKVSPETYSSGDGFRSYEAMSPAVLDKVNAYVTDYLGMEKIEETDEVVVYQRT